MAIIRDCDDWYSNRAIKDFHERVNLNNEKEHIDRLNMAKRCCSDDANLCEIISVVPEENSTAEQFIEDILDNNRFDVMYRRQLEGVSAAGTAGAYIYLQNANYIQKADGTVVASGGDVRINYIDADCIIPLTVENGLVTECAFSATNKVRGKESTTLVIFIKGEDGNYLAETVIFDYTGKIVESDNTTLQLGPVKPFAIMQNAEVNNLDGMVGYGLPKIYNAIPYFKALDLTYSILFGDLDKGQKMVFINELLGCIKRAEDGTPRLTPKQKKLFLLVGEKLPEEDSLVKEYNPELRIEDVTKAFELILSLISLQFGYGTKKYTFENGQITTATQYIGEKQDQMQELNKQRKQAIQYITDILHACMWFSNEFNGTNYNIEEDFSIEFDDSYIEDKATELERMRNDALQFPEVSQIRKNYFIEAYNLTEEEADEWIEGGFGVDDAEEEAED